MAIDAASRHDAAYLTAEARYAAGTRELLERWFEGRPNREEYLIVDGGKLAGAGAHSYSAGDATRGSRGRSGRWNILGRLPMTLAPSESCAIISGAPATCWRLL